MFALKELVLVIKQGFKLLNAFSFGLKDKVMLLVRQTFQVSWSVIIWYPIEMVNNPAFRQWLAMSLLPNKDMLHYIPIFTCPGMLRFKYHNIAIVGLNPTTYPIRMMLTCLIFIKTIPTELPSKVARFTTMNARMLAFLSPYSLLKCLFRGIFCFPSHNIQYTIQSSDLQAEVLR